MYKFLLFDQNTNLIKIFYINSKPFFEQMNLEHKVRENPNVNDVTFAMSIIGQHETMGSNVDINGEKALLWEILVRWDFMKFMEIPIIAGRDFTQEDTPEIPNKDVRPKSRWFELYRTSKYIMNEKAHKMYGIKLDSTLGMTQNRVIDMAGDVNTRALHEEVQPMFSAVGGKFSVMYIKVNNTDTPTVIDFINKQYDTFNSIYNFDIQFYDQLLGKMYNKEEQLVILVTIFSGLAIVIALIGVFELIVFETQYRRREIAIRKINGASLAIILSMFNRKFLLITLGCSVVSIPLAWYFVSEWLKSFPYRTQIYWWVFLIVLIITLFTVTVQYWRTANENPIKSLKSE